MLKHYIHLFSGQGFAMEICKKGVATIAQRLAPPELDLTGFFLYMLKALG